MGYDFLPHISMIEKFGHQSCLQVPVGADLQMKTWYPVTALFRLFDNSWNFFVISAYVIGITFTHWLAKYLTKSDAAAVVSGLVYGMSGFFTAHLGHTNMIHAAAWLSAIILGLHKMRDNTVISGL